MKMILAAMAIACLSSTAYARSCEAPASPRKVEIMDTYSMDDRYHIKGYDIGSEDRMYVIIIDERDCSYRHGEVTYEWLYETFGFGGDEWEDESVGMSEAEGY